MAMRRLAGTSRAAAAAASPVVLRAPPCLPAPCRRTAACREFDVSAHASSSGAAHIEAPAAAVHAPEPAHHDGVPEAVVDADADAEGARQLAEYTEVLVTTETEVEESGFQPYVALSRTGAFLTGTPVGKGLLAAALLAATAAGVSAARAAYAAQQTPAARRRRQIARNKSIADGLSRLLPAAREKLTPGVVDGLCRSTKFTKVEVFRKYLWFLLRERKFDQDAVDDLVALKSAAGLSDDEVAEAVGDRAQRVYDEYGTLMLNTEGFTQNGLARKAACQSLCQKILYLSECDALVAHGSAAAQRINLRTIFGATEEDLSKLRMSIDQVNNVYISDSEEDDEGDGAPPPDDDARKS